MPDPTCTDAAGRACRPRHARSPGPLLRLGVALLAVAATACAAIAHRDEERPGVRLDLLRAPTGFEVTLFADGLDGARQMALSPDGTLFVGTSAGTVHALALEGTRIVRRHVVASGLRSPAGVAFARGSLYVSDRTRILRYPDIERALDAPPPPIVALDGLPDRRRHDARALSVGPDGLLYVAVGAPCDTCLADGDAFGHIRRIELDGANPTIVARGIRNSVGFDWHPSTRRLWFTDNGPDGFGDDGPQDELNRVGRTGEHFGFPHCHGGTLVDPQWGAQRSCAEFTPPVTGLGAHVAALGMKFVRLPGPAADELAILVARHGSHPPLRVGYDVVGVRFDGDRVAGVTPFLDGFLQGRSYWGRPVDVLQLPDTSVLVSDDLNGVIYRVAAPKADIDPATPPPPNQAGRMAPRPAPRGRQRRYFVRRARPRHAAAGLYSTRPTRPGASPIAAAATFSTGSTRAPSGCHICACDVSTSSTTGSGSCGPPGKDAAGCSARRCATKSGSWRSEARPFSTR